MYPIVRICPCRKFRRVILTLGHALYQKHLKKHPLKMDISYLKIEGHKTENLEMRLNRTAESDSRNKS